MRSALWWVFGVAVGGLAVAAMRPPKLDGCCRDLADAAADKVAELLGGEKAAASIRKVLDVTGITELLPRMIAASKGR